MNKKHVLYVSLLLCLGVILMGISFGRTNAKAAPLHENDAVAEDYDDYYGYGYDDYTPTHSPIWIFIAIGAGLLVAAISGSAERSSMKTVRQETQARNYVNRESLIMDNASELFLYKRTERTPIQQQQPQMVGGMPMQASQQQGVRQAYQQNPTMGGYGGSRPTGMQGPTMGASVRPAYQPTTMSKVPTRSEVPNRTAQHAASTTQAKQSVTPTQKTVSHNTGSNFSGTSSTVNHSMNQATRNTSAIRQTTSRPTSSVSGTRSTVSRPTSSVSRPTSSVSRPSSSVSRPSTPSRPSGPSRPSTPSRPSGTSGGRRPK